MIEHTTTSIFDSRLSTLTVPVNCVGVMGAGLAKEFKTKFPDIENPYRIYCQNLLKPGTLALVKSTKNILLFPTKDHWRDPSKIEYIEKGLQYFCNRYESMGIKDVSFPKLGCGLGGLNWDDVQKIIELHLKSLPIMIYIHT
jgi:O-acetyl-ADP-ribose deacetylase (regulator of RNase III)